MATPTKGVAFDFNVSLRSQVNPTLFQANPTLASGDVKVSIDNGAFSNLTTLPTVSPASGTTVKVSLSAAEMTGDRIDVKFEDASGAEWHTAVYHILTASIDLVSHSGTAQSGTSTTIRLATAASSTDDFYNDQAVLIVAGTGAGQTRRITDYTGSTRDATVATWVTNPDSTSVYRVLGRVE